MPTIEKAEILSLFKRLKPRLAEDALFSGGDADRMERYLQLLPGNFRDLFVETLHGDSEEYRYAGIVLAAAMVREFDRMKAFVHPGNLVVRSEDFRFYPGHVRVQGDIVLRDQAIMVLAGNLAVDGNIVGAEWDYSMLGAGGKISCNNVMTQGEILAGGEINVADVAYFYRNDYSSMARRLKASIVVQNDSFDNFGEVIAEERVEELVTEEAPDRFEYVCQLLRLPRCRDIADLERRLRARLTGQPPG